MINVFLDIETIPNQNPNFYNQLLEETKSNFKAPPTLTKEAAAKELGLTDKKEIQFTSKASMIEAWEQKFKEIKVEEVAKEKLAKTSLNGGYGEVVSIAFAIDNNNVESFIRKTDEDEESVINWFHSALDEQLSGCSGMSLNPRFIAHNAIFDIRFLYHRCVINKISTSFNYPHDGRHGKDYFDTMQAWAGYGQRIKLDELAKILGVQGKTEGMDGSLVWPAIQAGEYEKVRKYNEDDVELVRSVYNRINFFD